MTKNAELASKYRTIHKVGIISKQLEPGPLKTLGAQNCGKIKLLPADDEITTNIPTLQWRVGWMSLIPVNSEDFSETD